MGFFIDDLEELPFDVFIKCDCDHDYRGLIRANNSQEVTQEVTQEALEAAWMQLYTLFLAQVNQTGLNERMESVGQIELLNTKILHVNSIITLLQYSITLWKQNEQIQGFDPNELTKALALWGYSFSYNDQTLERDLETLKRWLTSERLKLHLLVQKYNERIGDKPEQREHKRTDYLANLLVLAQHRGVKTFRPAELNTTEYCLMLKEFQEYNEAMAAANSKC